MASIPLQENTMANLILYKRVSTQEQGDSRNGLEGQTAELTRFALSGGHEVIASYEEIVSGKHGLDRRPVLRAAMAHAARCKGLLVVSKLDRLSRSVAFISTLMASGLPFATAEDGIDCSTLTLHIKASIAEHERKMISERTKSALASVKARGIKLGGITSGAAQAIANSTATNRREADAFALHISPVLLRMRQQGMSVNNIAAELNIQGNRTARGGQWHAKTVSSLLKRIAEL
jgi:DNA invertase Pin-like site-specific DNA recombinase